MAKLIEYASREEAAAARKLVDLILDKGWSISVNDGEEWTVKRSSDRKAILSALCTTGEDTLGLHEADGCRIGVLLLVWGNSAPELVADYSDNPEINALWDEWHALVDV